jgi:hypothetical protein
MEEKTVTEKEKLICPGDPPCRDTWFEVFVIGHGTEQIDENGDEIETDWHDQDREGKPTCHRCGRVAKTIKVRTTIITKEEEIKS